MEYLLAKLDNGKKYGLYSYLLFIQQYANHLMKDDYTITIINLENGKVYDKFYNIHLTEILNGISQETILRKNLKFKEEGNVSGPFYEENNVLDLEKIRDKLNGIKTSEILIVWDLIQKEKHGSYVGFDTTLPNLTFAMDTKEKNKFKFVFNNLDKIHDYINLDIGLLVDIKNKKVVHSGRVFYVKTSVGFMASSMPIMCKSDKTVEFKIAPFFIYDDGKIILKNANDYLNEYKELQDVIKDAPRVSGKCEICKKTEGKKLINIKSQHSVVDRHCNMCLWLLRSVIINKAKGEEKSEVEASSKLGDW